MCPARVLAREGRDTKKRPAAQIVQQPRAGNIKNLNRILTREFFSFWNFRNIKLESLTQTRKREKETVGSLRTSNQLLHDKSILRVCRLPPFLPLLLNTTPKYTCPSAPLRALHPHCLFLRVLLPLLSQFLLPTPPPAPQRATRLTPRPASPRLGPCRAYLLARKLIRVQQISVAEKRHIFRKPRF